MQQKKQTKNPKFPWKLSSIPLPIAYTSHLVERDNQLCADQMLLFSKMASFKLDRLFILIAGSDNLSEIILLAFQGMYPYPPKGSVIGRLNLVITVLLSKAITIF